MNTQRIATTLIAAGLCEPRLDPDDARRRPLYPTVTGAELRRSSPAGPATRNDSSPTRSGLTTTRPSSQACANSWSTTASPRHPRSELTVAWVDRLTGAEAGPGRVVPDYLTVYIKSLIAGHPVVDIVLVDARTPPVPASS